MLDPEERCTCFEASRASWLNRRFAATTRAPHAEEEDGARNAIVRYAGYTKLKKMVRKTKLFGDIGRFNADGDQTSDDIILVLSSLLNSRSSSLLYQLFE